MKIGFERRIARWNSSSWRIPTNNWYTKGTKDIFVPSCTLLLNLLNKSLGVVACDERNMLVCR